jgi:protein-disulfide isomerase
MNTKTAVALAFSLLAANFSLAQTSRSDSGARGTARSPAQAKPTETKLPTQTEVEAAMKRTLGYDPSIRWVIHDIRPSVIPGVADVLVSINKQAAQHIYMSTDTQNAIIGEIIPFGPNPFVPARTKLQAADGPAKGPQTSVITMVEFSDLECPHCKAAHPILEKLLLEFPQVRYVFQHFPLSASLHPWAMKAAEYADCAGRGNDAAFWKYLDTIFENQGSIVDSTADDKLKEFAGTLGLDSRKIAACAALPQTEARIRKSLELGESLEVTQTPTVFINGRRVLSIASIPYEQLKNLVQFEIDHAGK